MPNWLIVVACIVVLSFGIIHGLLMLISPERHRRFNLRVSDPLGRLKSPVTETNAKRALELEYRFTGLAIVIMCGLIALGVMDSLFGHHHGGLLPTRGATRTITIGKAWWGFVAAAGCLVFGAYAFLRPLQLYEWSTRRALPPSVAAPESRQIRRGGRFLGICFVILGLISLWLELKRITH